MTLDLVDTHCHLHEAPLASDVEAVLARARAAGVRQCLTVGTSLETSAAGVALAQRHPSLRAAVGVHPSEAGAVTPETLRGIERLSHDPAVAAIGEIGVDHYRMAAPPARQREVFEACLDLARRRGLPVLLHCRDAYDEALHVLRAPAWRGLRGVVHCASGPPAFIEAMVALGWWVSFAGNVTFPNAKALRLLVPLVPDDRLLAETDAPWLAPQAVRGQTNEPAFIAETVGMLASLRGRTAPECAALTSANARACFGLTAQMGGDDAQ
jgi:TatD DNase family protein